MEAQPNWSRDYILLEWLLDERFAIHAFHPNGGHVLIADNYCFTQSMNLGFSVVNFHTLPMYFHTTKEVVRYCEAEKIEFIDPFNAYTVAETGE